jgi:hypothetical protein
MNLNSAFVQWALRFGLSKAGILVTTGVAWALTHAGLHAFVSADDLKQIQDGLDAGGMALLALIYAWLVHRQQAGIKVLQTQLNVSELPSTTIPVNGVVGNRTLAASAQITGVTVEKAKAMADSGVRF